MDPYKGLVSVPLSNYAQQYRNHQMIADIVAPRVGVTKQAGQYWIHAREGLKGAGLDDTRAPGAAAMRIKRALSSDTYFTPDHAAEDVIADEEPLADDTSIDPRQDSTRIMMDQLLLRHEKRVADKLTTAANFAAGLKVQLAGTDQWSDAAASDPVGDVKAGVTAIELAAGVSPNILVLSKPVLDKLTEHTDVKDRVKYTKLGAADLSDLASLFGVDRVLVAKAIQRSDADVNTFVWGKHAVLLYAQQQPSLMDVSAAKTFVWTSAPGTVGGFRVQTGRAAPVSRSADEISTHFYHDEKITAVDAMYLIEDAVA